MGSLTSCLGLETSAEKLTFFHKDLAKPVLTLAVADSPELIVPGVAFNQFVVCSLDYLIGKDRILPKLLVNDPPHNINTDVVPILAKLNSASKCLCGAAR